MRTGLLVALGVCVLSWLVARDMSHRREIASLKVEVQDLRSDQSKRMHGRLDAIESEILAVRDDIRRLGRSEPAREVTAPAAAAPTEARASDRDSNDGDSRKERFKRFRDFNRKHNDKRPRPRFTRRSRHGKKKDFYEQLQVPEDVEAQVRSALEYEQEQMVALLEDAAENPELTGEAVRQLREQTDAGMQSLMTDEQFERYQKLRRKPDGRKKRPRAHARRGRSSRKWKRNKGADKGADG